MIFSEEQRDLFALCSFISATLSLAGSVFIFICFFTFFRTRRKKFAHRLVLYLSLAHFALSISWLLGGSSSKNLLVSCSTLAPLRYYFCLASFIWTSCIATEMLRMWVSARENHLGEIIVSQRFFSWHYEVGYHVLGWVLPGIVTVWPSFLSGRSQSLWDCWFDYEEWTYVFLAFVAVCFLYCLFIYCLALFHQFSRFGSHHILQESRRTELRFRVTSYLLAFLVTWVRCLVFFFSYKD